MQGQLVKQKPVVAPLVDEQRKDVEQIPSSQQETVWDWTPGASNEDTQEGLS